MLFWIGCFTLTSAAMQEDRVLLRDVHRLTFYNDHTFTNARRVPPVLKMKCIGGNACSYSYYIKKVECINKGRLSNGDTLWKCEADSLLAPGYEIGTAQVNCEGYDSSVDPYVLDGSCGLEYTMHFNAPPIPLYPVSYFITDTVVLVVLCLIVFMGLACVLINDYLTFHPAPCWLSWNPNFNTHVNPWGYGYNHHWSAPPPPPPRPRSLSPNATYASTVRRGGDTSAPSSSASVTYATTKKR